MSDQDEARTAGQIADDQSETDTPLQGIELPDDAVAAGKLIESLTQDMKTPPFWGVKKGRKYRKMAPDGVRPYPNVALVIMESDLWKQGLVKLRYHDSQKSDCVVTVLEMGCGVMLKPSEVEQQYVVAQKGHYALSGKKVGS